MSFQGPKSLTSSSNGVNRSDGSFGRAGIGSTEVFGIDQPGFEAEDARMFAIGHAQRVALLLQRQTVRNVKRRPERVDQDPVGAEFQDAAVAVAVRYEEDAVRGHGHVGRLAEVGRVAAGHERRTQRQRRQPTAFRKLNQSKVQ